MGKTRKAVPLLLQFLEVLLLVTALSVDAFVASFAYGSNKIKLPFSSVSVITLISSAALMVSLLVGGLIRTYVPGGMTRTFCFLILFALGITKLFDSSIKSLIRKRRIRKKLHFSFFHLKFILNIYANPEEADCDASQTLSPKEAVPLAFALSLDGLAVGFGAALTHVNPWEALLCSLAVNTAAIMLGGVSGNKIAEKIPVDLSWLGGALLLVLAFLKLR